MNAKDFPVERYALAAALLICIFSIVLLSALGRNVPDVLSNLATVTVGALGGAMLPRRPTNINVNTDSSDPTAPDTAQETKP